MSSTTADPYPESVGSCHPPTPPASPPPHPAPAVALRGAPVRRQLDFADADAGAGAGGDRDDYDDFILSAVDDIERGYNEAKRRAPPCVCRRGDCAVQRDNKRGRWMYVCSSQPVSLPTHLQLFSPLLAFFPPFLVVGCGWVLKTVSLSALGWKMRYAGVLLFRWGEISVLESC